MSKDWPDTAVPLKRSAADYAAMHAQNTKPMTQLAQMTILAQTAAAALTLVTQLRDLGCSTATLSLDTSLRFRMREDSNDFALDQSVNAESSEWEFEDFVKVIRVEVENRERKIAAIKAMQDALKFIPKEVLRTMSETQNLSVYLAQAMLTRN